jgi:hypothetical protein
MFHAVSAMFHWMIDVFHRMSAMSHRMIDVFYSESLIDISEPL